MFRHPITDPGAHKQAQVQPFHTPRRAWVRHSGQTDATARRFNSGEFEIIDSSVLHAEISMISPKIKEENVLSLVKHVTSRFAVVTDIIEKLAADLMKTCAIDAMDALHIAVAIKNEAELFITTDDIILNKANCISTYKIIVKNPCEV